MYGLGPENNSTMKKSAITPNYREELQYFQSHPLYAEISSAGKPSPRCIVFQMDILRTIPENYRRKEHYAGL